MAWQHFDILSIYYSQNILSAGEFYISLADQIEASD
jgi:hypothetical protein